MTHSGSTDVPESWKRRVAWFLLLPIFAFFIYLVIPIGNWIEYSLASRRLKRKPRSDLDVPKEKTISALWSAYGLHSSDTQYTSEDFSDCLCQWAEYLYGQGTAANLQIAKRLAGIEADHPASCKQLDTRDSTGQRIHAIICYRRPTDQLVVQLNDELPPYA